VIILLSKLTKKLSNTFFPVALDTIPHIIVGSFGVRLERDCGKRLKILTQRTQRGRGREGKEDEEE